MPIDSGPRRTDHGRLDLNRLFVGSRLMTSSINELCDEQMYRESLFSDARPAVPLGHTRLSAVMSDAPVEGGDVRAVLGAPAMTPCLTAFLAFPSNWLV